MTLKGLKLAITDKVAEVVGNQILRTTCKVTASDIIKLAVCYMEADALLSLWMQIGWLVSRVVIY